MIHLLGLLLMTGTLGPGLVEASPWVPPAAGQDVIGTWAGRLAVPGSELRIVFHISRQDDGALSATLDSPDQGAYGIPVSDVSVTGDTLRMAVQAVAGSYEGIVSPGEARIEGTWSQGGMDFPLSLERSDEAAGPNRPQEPEPPFPYRAEEVTFEHADAEVRLAGTLTLPPGDGPHPAVVLISGSGPQDRDETVFGHKPFLVLADYLTRRGIAVLRYDDRGVGGSTGEFGTATTDDFAGDALAAVDFLSARAEIGRIGLIGHSEGGLIAPIVANRSDAVGFLVLLAGPGVTGEEILYEQAALINASAGVDEASTAENRRQQERLFAVLRDEPDDARAAEHLRAILRESLDAMSEAERAAQGVTDENLDVFIERQVQSLLTPWMRHFLKYDPRPVLRRLDVPVLAVFGEKDLQVPPAQSVPEMERALAASDAAYRIVALPGLNHLMQPAETGSPTEYGRIEETMAPAALTLIGDWLIEQTGQ